MSAMCLEAGRLGSAPALRKPRRRNSHASNTNVRWVTDHLAAACHGGRETWRDRPAFVLRPRVVTLSRGRADRGARLVYVFVVSETNWCFNGIRPSGWIDRHARGAAPYQV